MLDTRKLEELARLELGRIVSTLVMMMTRCIGQQHFQVRGSQSSLSRMDISKSSSRAASSDPVAVSLATLRSVFSSVGCVVVASTLDTCPLPDYSHCVTLLSNMVES